MLLEIAPVSDKNHTCLESVYATFLLWNQKRYELLFAGSWSFYLEETDSIFGTRLSNDRGGAWRNTLQDQYMEQYYGIKVVWHETENFEELTRIVDENLNKCLPTCICLDSYWCPWVPSYQIYDTPHYFLIVGKDDISGNYFCTDPQYPAQIHELTLYNFEKGFYEEERLNQEYGKAIVDGFGGCASFFIGGCEKEINYISILEEALAAVFKGSGGKSDFHYMRAFADELGQMENILPELPKLSEVDPHHSWIFRRLEHIAWGRLNFARLLRSFYSQHPHVELLELENQFETGAKKWENINFMLLKACYLLEHAGPLLKKISGNLYSLAKYEEEIAEGIKSVLQRTKGAAN
ncbi:BtrH N-terminal domain-containing protein [Paenibacillus borealis]|uniref:Butirosin biosynthesis protein H N-terminal domain-containing protein n=1 Tax=Paenibacillus borealis TaxID=160799 RepID=A0A089MK88_PAEBO|nr:BtrH N-terminal domain-containing protein [Paenibacillus borealis]AIQ56944.1 hypothetical protein PBOR_08340 [Paenibacillus borealis]